MFSTFSVDAFSLFLAQWPLSLRSWRSALAWFQFNQSEWILLSNLTHSPCWRVWIHYLWEFKKKKIIIIFFLIRIVSHFRKNMWSMCVCVYFGSPFSIPLIRLFELWCFGQSPVTHSTNRWARWSCTGWVDRAGQCPSGHVVCRRNCSCSHPSVRSWLGLAFSMEHLPWRKRLERSGWYGSDNHDQKVTGLMPEEEKDYVPQIVRFTLLVFLKF